MSVYDARSMLFKNFLCAYPLVLFMAFFKSSKKMTKYQPSLNLIGLENQLHFFGTIVITSLGIFVSYKYYENSPDFEENPDRSSLNPNTKCATIVGKTKYPSSFFY